MSSDFERLLRKAREALPQPDADVTVRARDKAVSAVAHRRRVRFSSPIVFAAALAVALGLGVALGALLTPSGSAAEGPRGVGFLPAPGWSVYQAGTSATVARPATAIAANVPLSREDFTDGRPDPSELPYSTLLSLPRTGVVIAVDFTLLREHTVYSTRKLFRAHQLPLSLRDAVPADEYGTQIRPARPLGQYQLRAAIKGYAVDVRFYFGTPRPSPALVTAAQRQLDRLVVAPLEARRRGERPRGLAAQPETAGAGSAIRIVDRTFRCAVSESGGIPKIEVSVAAGLRQRGQKQLTSLAQGGFNTFDPTKFGEDYYLDLGGLTAGWPPPRNLRSGGLSVSLDRCTPTSAARPALSSRGLSGGAVDGFEDKYECFPPKTMLLRLRAVFQRPTSLTIDRRGGGRSLFAIARITKGAMIAQAPSGRPIAFFQLYESGKALLFTNADCVLDPS